MPKKTDDVQNLIDTIKNSYADLHKKLPAAIEAAQKKMDQAQSELLQLQELQKSLPDVELEAIAPPKAAARKKVVRKAKAKAMKVQSLSAQLKQLRAQAEMSQAQVARIAKIPQSSLCQFERGSRAPSEDSLKKIAKAYGVPVDSLKSTGGPAN